MLRKEAHLALNLLAGALPARGVAFYVRRATADAGYLHVAGDSTGLTGWTAEDWISRGTGWRAHVHPDDLERVGAALADLEDGEERAVEYRFVGPDGRGRWVHDSFRAIPGEPGGPWEVVGVLRDAEPERALRAQVSALEERIWQSQRMESLGALAGGVAHDFNNLLTTILTTVQLVEQEGAVTSPSLRRDLRMIRQAAERGSGMVRQILRFAARREHATGPVDLDRVVGELEGILRRRLGPEIRLELRLEGGLPRVLSDSAQLEQVVLNLAVNAREAMSGAGELRIHTALAPLREPLRVGGGETLSPGDYVQLSVRDSGPGIPAALRDRIFEPFFTTKPDGMVGAGFGLSTVQRIARGHGGGVVLECPPEGGAVFRVYLPVRELPSEHPAAALASVTLPAPASGVRVLVVEDDPSVRELVRRALTRDGHAVAAVGTAGEALRAFDLARPAFDAAVIDLVLPDRSGGVLARALRRRRADLALLFVSGYGEPEGPEAEQGLFLAKPFSAGQLGEALRAALGRAGTRPADPDLTRAEPA